MDGAQMRKGCSMTAEKKNQPWNGTYYGLNDDGGLIVDKDQAERLIGEKYLTPAWRDWYAWRPVLFRDEDTGKLRFAWCRTIQRKRWHAPVEAGVGGVWMYREVA